MGISGLLPCLRSVSRAAHVQEYRGQRVAVDSYVWLHRGAFTCARELALGVPTDKFVAYFMRCVEMLQRAGVEPLCVFDGDKLPSKAAEEAERERKRAENLEKAQTHERSGNHAAAYECYQRAVDVSPAMAARVIQELRRAGVPFLVAPFEADAQMAFLCSSGAVVAVITEDSDLVALGVARCFLKLDVKTGAGFELAAASLPRCRELNLGGLSAEQFTQLCALSGCDYAPGVPNIGPRKAAQLLRRFRTAAAAVRHLRFEGVAVPAGYEATLQAALWTFAHAFVYDPALRRCVHRTPLLPPPAGMPPDRVTAVLGQPPEPEQAQAIAEGRLCPITKQPFPESVFAPAADAPRRRAAPASAPPPQRNSVVNYFARLPQTVPGAGGRSAPAAQWGAPASAGKRRASGTPSASASAEPEAAEEEDYEEDERANGRTPVAPSTFKRARAAADMLTGILGGAPTPAHAISVYADGPPGSASSAGAAGSVEPSPARAHPLSWPAAAGARPLPRPLQPRPANLASRLAAVAPPPRRCSEEAAVLTLVARTTSKFFSPPQARAGPVTEAADATAAYDDDAAVEEEAPVTVPHRAASSPALGADVRHCVPLAAAAAAALDARFDTFRRDSAGAAGGAALRSPTLRSPVVPRATSAAKRARGATAAAAADAAAPSPRLRAATAGAADFSAFAFTPRAKR